MVNLMSQRAVPLHRTLRGHVSPKMPDAFWLSRSAVQGDVLPGTAATDLGTCRHCMMWRITIHQLLALSASSAPAEIWQAGTLHIVLRAPWSRGRACRMTFKPAAGDFGETLVLILDYAGPAITTFMTLRNAEASLRAPVRAALDVTGPASERISRNCLRKILYDGFFDDLPPALQIIDQEQRDILTAMAASDAPVQVIHALAGSGKSTILQCLVALFAKHHAEQLGLEALGAAPLDSEAGSVLVFILRTRTLRHEFLQTLMHNQVLQPRQVIFGGRLPDRFLEAGVFDDDAAHFQNIVLSMPEPSRLLQAYEIAKTALMAWHEESIRTHAVDASWAQVGEVVVLKREAKKRFGKTLVVPLGLLGGRGSCVPPGRRAAGDNGRGTQDLRPCEHARIASGEVDENKVYSPHPGRDAEVPDRDLLRPGQPA